MEILSPFTRSLFRRLLPVTAVASWFLVAWGFLGTGWVEPRESRPYPSNWGPGGGLGKGGEFLATSDVVYDAKGKPITYQRVRVWDRATLEERAILVGHTDLVWGVALSPDGRSVATASGDGTARVWDVATGRERLRVGKPPQRFFFLVAFAADGRSLVTAHGGGRAGVIQRWDLSNGRELASLPLQIEGVEFLLGVYFDDEGRAKAVGRGKVGVEFYDVDSGRREHAFTFPGLPRLRAAAVSPDGQTLATTHVDGTLRLWDVASGNGQPVPSIPQRPDRLTFSPDGRHLAVEYSRESALSQQARALNNSLGDWMAEQFRGVSGTAIFDTATGECWSGLPWTGNPIFTSDGTTLVVETEDGLQYWDIPPRRALFSPIAWAFLGLALILNGLCWYRRRSLN